MAKAENRTQNQVALVVGATGVAGTATVNHLAESGWRVYAVSRSITPGSFPAKNVAAVQVDVFDGDRLRSQLLDKRITHVFYTALFRTEIMRDMEKRPLNSRLIKIQLRLARPFVPLLYGCGGWVSNVFQTKIAKMAGAYDGEEKNLTMLQNVVAALEGHPLEHVAIVTGGKFYGVHLGPYLYPNWKTPFCEDDAPHPGPNFYFDLEQWLRERAGDEWTWSVVRPHFLIGYASGAPFNLGTAIAEYAHLLRELGLPLIFPGDERTYDAQWEMSCARGLARLMEWTATHPRGVNQIFNATNDDPFRWRDLWPRLASFFDMEHEVRPHGLRVQKFLADKGHIWKKLVEEHGLIANPLEALLPLQFLDKSMVMDWGVHYSQEKVKSHGYSPFTDTCDMFVRLFDELRAGRIIPSS